MKVLVDTNVLLRALQRNHPSSAVARNALKYLHRQETTLCLTPQNIREFWNVCTRPADQRSGLGLTILEAGRHLKLLERFFIILPDSAGTYDMWRTLVTRYEVSGAKVHDAYLAAGIIVHGVTQILSFNISDFVRYKRNWGN